MPAISKIRLTNVVYEDGDKRFNDEVFKFDGHNAAILLENGGGKTVFIHTVLQAILPHTNLGDRKIKETLQLENAPAHIGIEWIINERPRRYVTTVVSLFLYSNKLDSYRYVFEYEHDHPDTLEAMPFVRETAGGERPAYKEEMAEYYQAMKQKSFSAHTFETISGFHDFMENNYQIITNEWESIVKINRDEGGIEKFFETCRTTTDLYDRLLIPTVEDSIAGHEAGMFADMFEQQREGFKRYRDLQHSMKEHQAIQTELEKYVTEFEDYSKREAAYDRINQQAKGLLETIKDERRKIEQALATNETDWENWRTDVTLYERQKASYHILQESELKNELETEFLSKQTQFEVALEKLRHNEQLFNNLTYAKLQQALQTYKQSRDQYKADLDKHDAESEVADVEAELERENAKLHGYFLTKLEAYDKSIKRLKIEQRPSIEAIENLAEKITDVEEQLNVEKQQLHYTEGQMKTKQDEIERLKQSLLANPAQENIHDTFKKWTARYQFLEDEIIALGKQKNTAKVKIEQFEHEREAERLTENELVVKIYDQERNQNEMQMAHDALIEKLSTLRMTWKGIDDLHLKEGSVRGPLEDMEQRYEREREVLLLKERLAHRFVDDYGKQDIFFADAFLQERLYDWQNSIYVITGPTYFADLNEQDKRAYENYPLWPLTLVTIEADKDKLTEKLTEIQDRLQFPLSILTSEEVKHIGTSTLSETWISPQHWETNLEAVSFEVWKTELAESAAVTTKERIEKEAELAHCRNVKSAFEQFFQEYPNAKKAEIQDTLRTLQTEKDTIERKIEKIDQSIKQLKQEIVTIEERLNSHQSERNGLETLIVQARQYMDAERFLLELTEKQSKAEIEIAELTKELGKLNREVMRYEYDKKELDEQISENQFGKSVLQADSQYLAVKKFTPSYTDEAKEVIEQRREKLQRQIDGIRAQYGEIRAKFEQAEKDITRVETEMDGLVQMNETIDQEMEFPVDGDNLLNRAQENIVHGKGEIERLSKLVSDAKGKFDGQLGKLRAITEQFDKDFPGEEMFIFDMEIDAIEAFLQTTKQKLTERKTYLQAEATRIEKELADIEKAAGLLEKYEVAHPFNSTVVSAIPLTEKELMEFTYGRVDFVEVLTKELQDKKKELQEGKEKIDDVKSRFRAFCRDHISDRKLREMATTGIEAKNNYGDVLDYQQNMLKAVERADRIARDFISKQDKEVQAFINQIHNHLVNVTGQLRDIPRNTRVKVGDKWREIFKFTIPEWTVEDGKTRIRNHMDWILEQLQSDFFKNEQGLEDSTKVRKEIETWLHTKQLLQVVMDHKGMKASCRKVTNDNQVSSRLTSWEQSNQWSGGEKWSKNMTLFLGILNFVAEKKQHIQGKTKRHRAVLLDNPFGKASSDHVLNPVFFIAEQLGFQIIALTAHADGKFLQDYFPIIYSLKLRPTIDESKQVMTKEKSLHHAYFRDHDPEVIERLEEREQLELF